MTQRRMLTEQDREEISRGAEAGLPGKEIAVRIGRSPSVVSREIARPSMAQQKAQQNARKYSE